MKVKASRNGGPMPRGLQRRKLVELLVRRGLETDTIDVDAYLDDHATYRENCTRLLEVIGVSRLDVGRLEFEDAERQLAEGDPYRAAPVRIELSQEAMLRLAACWKSTDVAEEVWSAT